MKRTITRKCPVCLSIFNVTKGRHKGRRGVNVRKMMRGINCITCSPKCSKVFTRVYHYLKLKGRLK